MDHKDGPESYGEESRCTGVQCESLERAPGFLEGNVQLHLPPIMHLVPPASPKPGHLDTVLPKGGRE